MMISSRPTHAFRSHPLNVTLAALAPLLLALAIVAPAGAAPGEDIEAFGTAMVSDSTFAGNSAFLGY